MGIFSILFSSIGNLIWGVLLTIVGIALMFLIIKSWRKDAYFAPSSYLVGMVLFLFLSFQSILMCGAITIKSGTDEIRASINRMVEDIPEGIPFSSSNSQQILDNICEEYPIVGEYVDWADFEGHDSSNIADAMVEELNSFLNWYILRRIGWSVLFVVIGAVIVIKTMPRIYQNRRSQERMKTTQRRAPVSTRSARHRR